MHNPLTTALGFSPPHLLRLHLILDTLLPPLSPSIPSTFLISIPSQSPLQDTVGPSLSSQVTLGPPSSVSGPSLAASTPPTPDSSPPFVSVPFFSAPLFLLCIIPLCKTLIPARSTREASSAVRLLSHPALNPAQLTSHTKQSTFPAPSYSSLTISLSLTAL